MISKEQFVVAMNKLKKLDDENSKMTDALYGLGITAENKLFYCLMDDYIVLLENAMEVEDIDRTFGSDIDWFIFETQYGKDEKTNTIESDDKSWTITSAEELYDYIMECKEMEKNEA